MAYQALYRRWRPQGFDGIVGQDAVVTTLKNQIKSDRIGHAYLFCGTRGTGKTSAAKIFARAVNCPHAAEHDGSPCNECETCKTIAQGRSMNVIEIDAASNNGVDNIRDIRDQVEYPPVNGRFKVYIIDEVHMLSQGAYNALLKTLEEPPSYVIFILATTDPQKLPATILSRCQRYDFKRISKAKIAAHLKDITQREEVKVEDKALFYIAEAADGSMRDSLSILDQCLAYHCGDVLTYDNVLDILGAADDHIYSELFEKIITHDVEGTLEQIAGLINDGCETGRLINDFIMYLRNVLLVKSMGNNDLLELSEERYERALESAGRTDSETIIRVIASLSELANRTRFSTQRRTALEVELIRLCTYGMAGYGAVPNATAAAMSGSMAGGVANMHVNADRIAGSGYAAASPARPTDNGYAVDAAAYSYSGGGQGTAAAATAANQMSARLNVSLSGVTGGTEQTAQTQTRDTAAEAAAGLDMQSGGAGTGSAAQSAKMADTQQSGRPQPDIQSADGQQSGIQSGIKSGTQPDAKPQSQTGAGQQTEAQAQSPDGSIYNIIMQNWGMLKAGLSPSNRPLFNDILVKEEGNKIALIFRNQMNLRLAAFNKEENGVIRLRQLAEEQLHIRVNFSARAAKPGEISTEVPKATPEELAKINFPISIED